MTVAKRVIVTIIALAVVLAAVTGVAFASTSIELGVKAPGLYVDDTQVENPGTIVTIGANEVDFPQYRYEYLMNKEYTEMAQGEDIWSQDYDGSYAHQIKTTSLENLQEAFAWMQIAADNNIELDDEDAKGIQDEYDELVASHNGDADAALESVHCTDKDTYFAVVERQKLMLKTQEAYKEKLAKEKESDILKNDVITAKHILIQPDAEATDAAAAKIEAREKAEDILAQIRESEDTEKTFDKLMNEYSEDTGLEEYPDGYTFGKGSMVDVFYDSAAALKEGEVSDLVESDYGYHIILRMPLNKTYVEENKDDIITGSVTAITNDEIAAIIESMTFTPGEYYDEIAPGTII